MAGKKNLPGIDRESLAGLAKQYPVSQGPSDSDIAGDSKLPGGDQEALAGLAKQFPLSQRPASQAAQAADEPVQQDASDETASDKTAGDKTDDAVAPTGAARPKPRPKATVRSRSGVGPAGTASGPEAPAVASKSDSVAAAGPVPDKAPEPAAPRAAPRRRGGRVVASMSLLISLFALALALAALSPPQLRSWLQAGIGYPPLVDFLTGSKARIDTRLRDDAAALKLTRNGLAAHDARLAAIEAVGGSNKAAARRVDAVESLATESERKIRALDSRAASLAGRMDTAATRGADDGQRLAALEKQLAGRLTEIEAGLGALKRSSSGPAKLYLIALRLRIAAQSPGPFAKEVDAAATVGNGGAQIAAALKTLAGHATAGVATRAQLGDRFQRQLAPLLRGDGIGASRILFVQFRSWFNSMFLDGGDNTMAIAHAAAIVALAEDHLARGQLRAASEQLARLQGGFATAAAAWLTQARARVAVDAATATLMTEAFDRYISAND
jgi:hypothetical protein